MIIIGQLQVKPTHPRTFYPARLPPSHSSHFPWSSNPSLTSPQSSWLQGRAKRFPNAQTMTVKVMAYASCRTVKISMDSVHSHESGNEMQQSYIRRHTRLVNVLQPDRMVCVREKFPGILDRSTDRIFHTGNLLMIAGIRLSFVDRNDRFAWNGWEFSLET